MHQVAAIQMISGPDVHANLTRAGELIARAAAQGARLLLLPECFALFGSPHLARVAEEEASGARPIQQFLADQAERHGVWLIGGSIPLPRQPGGKAMAACLVFDDQGREVARYDKLHLFDVEVADNQRSYQESRDYGYGDQLVCIDTPVGRVGLSICYDLRFAELYLALRRAGAELIVVPSAFTAVTGAAHWDILLRARAAETQCYILAANQGGLHPGGRETFGHSCLVDPWGDIQAGMDQGEGVVIGALDPEYLESVRGRMPVLQHRRFAAVDTIVPAAKESQTHE
ncbi:carbon-nitrogen hydrolase family protein [Halopseudomonas laoshanensis]|uniref:Carbon-nitrogen hydrolase family protein n=1 Tax=Halopseudomonas laoshanensis TaxID=2268758 RepID=A0A7V7GR61_9GAMM|nr:carbon-nitrogen hydrolase family protein [Halopseudomonas laoshanensis]KAA0692414.1 carbon-nitrogen hydrolase family protein [Halopseudomonas laoshanensis]